MSVSWPAIGATALALGAAAYYTMLPNVHPPASVCQGARRLLVLSHDGRSESCAPISAKGGMAAVPSSLWRFYPCLCFPEWGHSARSLLVVWLMPCCSPSQVRFNAGDIPRLDKAPGVRACVCMCMNVYMSVCVMGAWLCESARCTVCGSLRCAGPSVCQLWGGTACMPVFMCVYACVCLLVCLSVCLSACLSAWVVVHDNVHDIVWVCVCV